MEATAAVGAAAAAGGGAERGSEPKDLFSHLPRYHADAEVQQLLSKAVFGVGLKAQSEVPPAAVQLGMKYMSGQIRGGSARCVALLRMLQVRASPPPCLRFAPSRATSLPLQRVGFRSA